MLGTGYIRILVYGLIYGNLDTLHPRVKFRTKSGVDVTVYPDKVFVGKVEVMRSDTPLVDNIAMDVYSDVMNTISAVNLIKMSEVPQSSVLQCTVLVHDLCDNGNVYGSRADGSPWLIRDAAIGIQLPAECICVSFYRKDKWRVLQYTRDMSKWRELIGTRDARQHEVTCIANVFTQLATACDLTDANAMNAEIDRMLRRVLTNNEYNELFEKLKQLY